MASKTLATIVIVFACLLFIPLTIGIIGGIFGIIAGIFGAIFGVIGALIGGIFGIVSGIFNGLFHWPFVFFHENIFTIAFIVLIIILFTRSKR